jgi:hypothetical protein
LDFISPIARYAKVKLAAVSTKHCAGNGTGYWYWIVWRIKANSIVTDANGLIA